MNEGRNRRTTKYWTFEDWREAGEEAPLSHCRVGIEKKDNDSGERVLFLMTPEEITKLETNLKEMYWNEVMQEFGMLKSDFQRGWSDTADPMQITREIEKAQFHLYPEKFVDKTEPYSISILYIHFKDDIPHYREAYANILSYGRPTWMTPLARDDENYSCRADGMKLYLDWLILFQDYLKSHKPTKQAIFDFESINGDCLNSVNETLSSHLDLKGQFGTTSDEESSLISAEKASAETKLKMIPCALFLRYSRTKITSPSYEGSKAKELAKELCGCISHTSGGQLYQHWLKQADNHGRHYHKKLLDRFTGDRTSRKTVTKHLKDLKSICDYLGSGEVYERVNSDYLYLFNELESLE